MAFIGDFEKLKNFLQGIEGVPLASKLLARSGVKAFDINTYEDFQKIKPITKRELIDIQKESSDSLFNCSLVTKIFQSPGPIYNAKGEEFEHYRFYKGLESAGFVFGDKAVNTFGYHMSPAGDMFDEACRRIGVKVFPLGPADSAKGAEVIGDIKANAFIGTRTYLFKCLEALGDSNTIEKAYLIAEKMTEADRKELLDKYGVKAFQGYGTAEFGMVGSECSATDGIHIDTSVIFVEVLEPYTYKYVPDGELGEIVITFMKAATPFVRFATGDLTRKLSDECSCGYLDRIAGIFGRSDNSVKVKGIFIHQWDLEKLALETGVSILLNIESDEAGNDVLKVVLDKNVEEFQNTFRGMVGLKYNEISFDEAVEGVNINDNRDRLKEN